MPTYTELLHTRMIISQTPIWHKISPNTRREKSLLDGIDSKLAGAEYAKGAGIQTSDPKLHLSPQAALLEGERRGGPFVVKPFNDAASNGVRVLWPSNGRWEST